MSLIALLLVLGLLNIAALGFCLANCQKRRG